MDGLGEVWLPCSPDSADDQTPVLARLLRRVALLEQHDTTLQSKVAALEERNARLEATVRALVQQQAGLPTPVHEHAAAVVTSTAASAPAATAGATIVTCDVTVVLAAPAVPFIDDQLFRLIASHLNVKTLGRLAQAGKRFGVLVEQVAQQRLAQLMEVEIANPRQVVPEIACNLILQPQHEQALQRLYHAEQMTQPHRFSCWGPEVVTTASLRCQPSSAHCPQDLVLSVAQKSSCGFETAVCAQVMHSGRHFIEVCILPSGSDQSGPTLPMVGVVGPDFDPRQGRPAWRSKHGYTSSDNHNNLILKHNLSIVVLTVYECVAA